MNPAPAQDCSHECMEGRACTCTRAPLKHRGRLPDPEWLGYARADNPAPLEYRGYMAELVVAVLIVVAVMAGTGFVAGLIFGALE
jgi:hypothetical protein